MGVFVSRPESISSIIFCVLLGVVTLLFLEQDRFPDTSMIPEIKTTAKPDLNALINLKASIISSPFVWISIGTADRQKLFANSITKIPYFSSFGLSSIPSCIMRPKLSEISQASIIFPFSIWNISIAAASVLFPVAGIPPRSPW